jgi:hypothetical protein
MADRSVETVVTFAHPFKLPTVDRELPAGSYRVTTDEAEIPGLSFLAYTHLATLLHVPAMGAAGRRHEVFTLGPDDLQTALAQDAKKTIS